METGGWVFDIERGIWMGNEIKELTEKGTEDEENPPSWKDCVYVGDLRTEKYPLQYMITFEEKRLLYTYVNDYMRNFGEVKSENPKRRILLFEKVDYRHVDEGFDKR